MPLYKLNCPNSDTPPVLISIRKGAKSFRCTQCDRRHAIAHAQAFDIKPTKELLAAAEAMADALVAYFDKRGAAHADRKGNQDIAAMADALSNYGYALAKAGEP